MVSSDCQSWFMMATYWPCLPDSCKIENTLRSDKPVFWLPMIEPYWTSFVGPADVMFWLRQFAGLSAHLQALATLRRNKCHTTNHNYAHIQLSESTGSQYKLKMVSSQCAYNKNTKRPNQAMWHSMTDMYISVPQSTDSKSQAEVNRIESSTVGHTLPHQAMPRGAYQVVLLVKLTTNILQPLAHKVHLATTLPVGWVTKVQCCHSTKASWSSRDIEGKMKLGSSHMNPLEIQDSKETLVRNDVNKVNKKGKASAKKHVW